MKASKFFTLKNIQGNKTDFHRNCYDGINFGTHCKRGVYFWGFYIGDNDNCIPEKPEDVVLYYIGKEQDNASQRIMQEITQFILGGFGTIVSREWLEKHPFDANLYDKQESDKSGTLDKDVLYKSFGLHVLNEFYTDEQIRKTVDWMFNRIIFTWIIEDDKSAKMVENYELSLGDNGKNELKKKSKNENVYLQRLKNKFLGAMESEFHHIAGRNTFGLGVNPPKRFKNIQDKKATPFFNEVDWNDNLILKNWLVSTNKKLFPNL